MLLKSALVTGCAGFIGSHLVEKLLSKNWHIQGIDNFHPYYSKILKEQNLKNFLNNKNFNFINGSILNESDFEKLDKNFDYVFHFAAIAGVRNSFLHPEEYFEINVKATEKLLQKYKDVNKFVFASSSSVYGDVNKNDLPVVETYPLNPIAPYGESKKQGEILCTEFNKKYQTPLAILRFYTVYGPRQRPDEAITKFIRLSQSQKPIPIYGDGTKERDFTFVSDIVDGTILAAERGNGVYNLGTGKPVSVLQMIKSIEKYMNKNLKKIFVDSPKGDVEKTHANIDKSKKELGYSPNYNLEEGIQKCVKWCMQTQNLLNQSIQQQVDNEIF